MQLTLKSVVIFDLDGTITKPILDFDVMREEIGVAGPILEAMAEMSPSDRERAEDILARYEREAAERAVLQDEADLVLARFRTEGIPVAILTRNSRVCTDLVLGRFGIQVDAIRTRDDGAIKPSADPVNSICRELEAAPTRSWMVGDYLFDIQSGSAAGLRTVLMIGDSAAPPFAGQADFVIRRLSELAGISGLLPKI